MTFTLPWPPSGNAMKAAVRGRMVKTKRARTYASAAASIALSQGVRPIPRSVPVSVSYSFYYDPQRRADLDNLVKTVQDALTGVAWHDDRQVWRLQAVRIARRAGDPEVMVDVTVMNHEAGRPG